MEEITIQCETCKQLFTTLYVVNDGQPYDFCCSIKCYEKYHTIENIRDRKLKNLVEPITK